MNNKPHTELHQSETILQNLIRCELSKHGIVIRLQSGVFQGANNQSIKCGFTGLSDLLFLSRDGKAVFLEVKTATGRPSAEQINFIETVRKMGFSAGIVRSVDEALELIKL
jgi:hypothetical protein